MDEKKKLINNLPQETGIYIFKDHHGHVIYVGKAKNIKKRVNQYFTTYSKRTNKLNQLSKEINSVETISTCSEFDALLLEADRIRTYLPKYNSIARDDKSPLYISVNILDRFPKISFVRKKFIDLHAKYKYFGPFQSSSVIRYLMRYIRKSIPYCTQKIRSGKPCFYTHLGLCNPCPSEIIGIRDINLKRQMILIYKNNIRRIMSLLSGHSETVIADLMKEMKVYSDSEEFERAHAIKRSIESIQSLSKIHFDPSAYVENQYLLDTIRNDALEALQKRLRPYYPNLVQLRRIECIDISNYGKDFACGSLVVFIDGHPENGTYKRFRIRKTQIPNDYAAIQEVIMRRLKHDEWLYPDLFIIDGGKGQVKIVQDVLKKLSCSIPVIGLAKRYSEIIIPKNSHFYSVRLPHTDPILHLITHIRDESHRFAISYHRNLRQRLFIKNE